MRSVWRRGLIGLLFACAAGGAQAQNAGVVSGADMNGYGRLIFSFKDMARASATVASGVLVVSFEQPVAVNLDKLSVVLPNYIGVARQDPDGRNVRFALTRSLRPSLKEAGEKLFLDLLPETWTGEPPGLPQDVVDDLARRARNAEEALTSAARKRNLEEVRAMPVRVGARPGLTRVVFDMPIMASANYTREGNRIEIAFEAALQINAPKLKAELGALAKSVDNIVEGASSRVIITAADKTDTIGFREDDTFVLDFNLPEPVRRKAATEPARDQTPPVKEAPPAQAQSAPATPEKKAAAETAAAANAAPREEPKAMQRPARADAPPAGPVKPILSQDGDTLRIAFPFKGAPRAAAFDRFGVATVLFETEQPIEAGDAPKLLSDIGGAWRFDQSAGGRIVRLSFKEPKLVRLAPDGEGWIVTVGDRLLASSEPATPRRSLDEKGRLMVATSLPGLGRIHWINDPDTGDRIAVATAAAPLRSVAKPYRYAQFELPPTAHGVAVVAYADDLVVRADIDVVLIERGDGLALSAVAAQPAARASGGAAASSIAFDRAYWADAVSGATRERLSALEKNVADAQRGDRNAARLEQARFMFANRLIPEARGVLELIVRDEPEAARDRRIALMRLAALVELRRFADARKMLSENGFRDEPEGQLWGAVIDARQRNWPRALVGFNAASSLIDVYPDALQGVIRGLWARAAVETRDFGAAQHQLEALSELNRENAPTHEIAILRARIDEAQGRVKEARAAYARIADGEDRRTAAEALLRTTLLGLADQSLPRPQAIAQLERIAAVWRGDGFVEADAIAELGRLYAEDSRWREAFFIARRGAEAYPDNDKIRALHDHAATLFAEIFTGGRSESLDRVQALALFYDFKDLTPPGQLGDDIVRHLAERLVELDLLENAAELLQHQIDNRVQGHYRAMLAARLAVIYLMNNKPAQALNALKTSRQPDLAYNLRRARNLLEARALSDLSRTDLALDIAAAESGPDVDRLTADIQWQGRRWRAAGETYERILGDRWKDRAPLTDRERVDVLRAGIAYSLAEEALSVDRLRGKYGPAMADSGDTRAFQLVTSPSSARAAEFRELARQLARADTLSEFLAEYRKRYPDIPPGAAKKDPPAGGAEPASPQAGAQKPDEPASQG